MKGLILKDVYGCRFQIIAGFALMVLPTLLFMAAGGRMKAFGGAAETVSVMVCGMINYMSIVVCSSFYLNTLSFDETSGWTKMQRAMPLSGAQIIGGKMLGAAAVVGILTMLSLGFNLINAAVYGFSAEPMTAMPICIGLLELITLLPAIVLGYRFGSKVTNLVYFAALVVVAAGIIVFLAFLFMGDIKPMAARTAAYAVIPALAAAVSAVCFVTGKRAVTVDI